MFPNNEEQQDAYDYIMNSIDELKILNEVYQVVINSTLLAGLSEWESVHCSESYMLHVVA